MKFFNSFIEKPKDLHFESQEPQEQVYFILRRHPITNLGWILMSIILISLPLVFMLYSGQFIEDTFQYIPARYQLIGFILWYLLTLLFTFESFLTWYFNVYIITNKRLIDVDFNGFWGKRISEATFDNVEDVTYETSKFLHVLFDYGDIFMQTAAEKTEFEFHSISKPGKVHDILTDLVEDYKKNLT